MLARNQRSATTQHNNKLCVVSHMRECMRVTRTPALLATHHGRGDAAWDQVRAPAAHTAGKLICRDGRPARPPRADPPRRGHGVDLLLAVGRSGGGQRVRASRPARRARTVAAARRATTRRWTRRALSVLARAVLARALVRLVRRERALEVQHGRTTYTIRPTYSFTTATRASPPHAGQ